MQQNKNKMVKTQQKKTKTNMNVNHLNLKTHDILAPDTATLKPALVVPCPFDHPLTLGLNFFRISGVKREKKKKVAKLLHRRPNSSFVVIQLCHLVVLVCIAMSGKATGLTW